MNRFLLRPVKPVFVLLLYVCALGLAIIPEDAEATLTVHQDHSRIDIDSFYHGSTISISGEYDPEADLIVQVTSDNNEHLALKKKGKVGGILWMNVGELEFKDVPSLYFVSSSKDITQMMDPTEADRYSLGLAALKRQVHIEPEMNPVDRDSWFDELVKMKKQSLLYREEVGVVKLSSKDGQGNYTLELPWPFQAQPGDYQVNVFTIKHGMVSEKTQSTIVVAQAGAVKYLAGMARENGALYGAIAIVVALVSGFGTGILFGKGGGSH